MCTDQAGIRGFLGVLYAPWMWYDKDDRTRRLVQRRGAEKQPEFFNTMVERHKDDACGYEVISFVNPAVGAAPGAAG